MFTIDEFRFVSDYGHLTLLRFSTASQPQQPFFISVGDCLVVSRPLVVPAIVDNVPLSIFPSHNITLRLPAFLFAFSYAREQNGGSDFETHPKGHSSSATAVIWWRSPSGISST